MMNSRVLIPVFVASIAGGLAIRAVDMGTVPWAVSRASGLAAFVVLSLSVVLGLLISTKAGDGILNRAFVFQMHQFLSVVSLVLIAVHAGSLLFDGFFHFTPLSLVLPFGAPYRPVAVGIGVLAGWLAAITTASYWMRSRIGQKRWRALHYLTFAAYAASLGHAITAGSDTHLSLFYWTYVVSLGAVLALTTLRLTGYQQQRRTKTARVSQPRTAGNAQAPHGIQ